MRYETPSPGRARIADTGDALVIEVRPSRPWFAIAFLSFWLFGWTIAGLAALGVLVTTVAGGAAGTESGPSLFLVAWLGAWAIGWIAAAATLLWLSAGMERVVVDRDGLAIERRIPVHRRVWRYAGDQIINLRSRPLPPPAFMGRDSLGRTNYFSGVGDGAIAFDYGLKTVGFGLDLDEAEARDVVRQIEDWLARHG